MSIKRILFPTDLTSGSDEALRYAVALTRVYEAKLIAFHCKSEDSEAEFVQTEIKAALERSLLKHLESKELAAIDWQPAVERCDDPGKAIAEYAAGHGVDLIVMHSRRRPHRAALLGSMAESVCRAAPCPVLVTHADERDWVSQASREIKLN